MQHIENWQTLAESWLNRVRDFGLKLVRPSVLEHEGNAYLYDDADSEYRPMSRPRDTAAHAPDVTLLDVHSLAKWAMAMDGEMDHGGRATRGQIVVSRRRGTTATTPVFIGPDTRRESATKEFFTGFLPGGSFKHTFGYVSFLTWLELLGPERLDGYDGLMIATKSVSASEGAVVKVENDGAFMKVHTESSKGAKGSAPVPKALDTRIPFGDPTCILPVRFRLVVTHDKGELRFTVEHVSTDGAFDAYVQWMLDKLSFGAPEGWTVLAAP